MRLNTKIFSTLLAIVVIVATLFSAGCATSNSKSQLTIYQGYEGPKKATEEVAIVDNFSDVLSIDGKEVNKPHTVYRGMEATYPSINYYRAELEPGLHTFKVYITGHASGPAVALIQATLTAGHAYELRSEHVLYAKNSAGFAVMLIDKANGDLVGGRTEEALNWSWMDVEIMLKEMAQDHATKFVVMENIGVPMALYPEEMLPEPARRGFKDATPESTLVYRHTELVLPSAGYLFVKFNQSDQLQDYYFVAVPIDECHENPLVWDWLGRIIREMSCKYSYKTIGYVEYYVQSGNPVEAYHTLEDGILNAHDNLGYLTTFPTTPDGYYEKLKKYADQASEKLISEGSIMMNRYPELSKAAQKSFSPASYSMSVTLLGDSAAKFERSRLAVYKRLVGSDEAANAEREYLDYFGVAPN
jgi:hypothetical protein